METEQNVNYFEFALTFPDWDAMIKVRKTIRR